jgi:hypothetical protein
MTVRVGVDLSVDEGLLRGWGSEVQFVRIPEDPKEEIEIDFWVPALPAVCRHCGFDDSANFGNASSVRCKAPGQDEARGAAWYMHQGDRLSRQKRCCKRSMKSESEPPWM